MLVVLARINEIDGLRRDILELRLHQGILADALQIALEELESLQKERSQEKLAL